MNAPSLAQFAATDNSLAAQLVARRAAGEALLDSLAYQIDEAIALATSHVTIRALRNYAARIAYSKRECPGAALADFGPDGDGPVIEHLVKQARAEASA